MITAWPNNISKKPLLSGVTWRALGPNPQHDDNLRPLALGLSDLGSVELSLGNLEAARQHLNEAVKILEDVDSHGTALVSVLISRAIVEEDLWDLKAAQADANRARQFAEHAGKPQQVSEALTVQAGIANRRGNELDAYRDLYDAWSIQKDIIPDTREFAQTLLLLGENEFDQRRPECSPKRI